MPTAAVWACMASWTARQLTKGMEDLPPADIQMVKDTLAQMLAGKFTRFDVFTGEIKDNAGKVIVPAGAEDAAGRSGSIPARRARPGMQVLHVLVESEHRRGTAETAVTQPDALSVLNG